MTVTLSLLYVLLLVTAVLQGAAAGRLAFAGLAVYAVAMASFGVYPGSGCPREIAAAAAASGAGFFAVNTGLLAAGVVLTAAAAARTVRERRRSLPGPALMAVSIYTLWQLRALALASGLLRTLLAALAAGGAMILVAGALRHLGRRDRRCEPPLRWRVRGRPLITAVVAAGALAVLLAPQAGLVFVGLITVAAADYIGRRTEGGAGVPWLLVAGLGLIPVWWLLATIAGPVGLGLASLGDVPLSPRAEILLALPLALIAWSFLGAWPAHRPFPGGLFAPLAVALWLRVARPALAEGLDHWRPLLMPLGVLGVWGGAFTGRSAAALNALAFVALASETRGSPAAALLLTASALALPAIRTPAWRWPQRGVAERLSWAVAALALPLMLEPGFRREVTYTLAAGVGAALAIWLGLAPPPEERDGAATDAGTPTP